MSAHVQLDHAWFTALAKEVMPVARTILATLEKMPYFIEPVQRIVLIFRMFE